MIDASNWKEFRFGDLLERSPYKGLAHKKEDFVECSPMDEKAMPYVTRTEPNNSVDMHVVNDGTLTGIEEGNALVVGDTTATISYQPLPFVCGDHIVVIRAEWLNTNTGLFIVGLLRRERFRYSYGRAFVMSAIEDTLLRLPADSDGNPDWAWMEQYMDSLSVKPITTAVKSLKMPLDIGSWGEFHVEDILTILNGKGITKDEITENPGDIEAIQSGEANLGILGSIDREYCKQMGYTMTDEMCLTVARSGTSGYVAYHPRGCVVGDSAKILLLKDPIAKTASIYLFIRTILEANRYKYCYGRKVTTEGYKYEMIKLPVDADSNPDWAWMEQYMKSLPYSEKINSSE